MRPDWRREASLFWTIAAGKAGQNLNALEKALGLEKPNTNEISQIDNA